MAYKSDTKLLPKPLVEKVAALHLPALGAMVSVFVQLHPRCLALQMRRLKGVFALSTISKKVRSPAASKETTRQVGISTLSAHQMAPAGVVAHSCSWTPAAYELEESSPPSRVLSLLDSARVHGFELPDGEEARRQGRALSDGSDRWQRRRERGAVQKYWNRGRPRVASGLCSLLSLWFCTSLTASRMFWDSGPCIRSPRVGGTFSAALRDGSDGWRSPVHLGDKTVGELVHPFRQPSRCRLVQNFAIPTYEMAGPAHSDGAIY